MGCVSSKMVAKEIAQEKLRRNGDYAHHVVSLTSSTYGVLSLDKAKDHRNPQMQERGSESGRKEVPAAEAKKSPTPSLPRGEEAAEIINAWEMMEGLEEEIAIVVQSKRSPKSKLFLRGFADKEIPRSPMKFLNQMTSPRKAKKVAGKENRGRAGNGVRSSENSPKTVLKESNNSSKKPSPKLWASIKGTPKCDSSRFDSGVVISRRRSLGPLFDPDLVASLEKEVSEEEEEIKKMITSSSSTRVTKSQNSDTFLESYKKKCPPGGENAVVIYTTTLRGIRKTFEDCNVARSIIESMNVEVFERDVSMHSAFKEELRVLMGSKEVKVPLVFVKGRLIGGAEEMMKLDEEGKLGILLDGIPAAAAARCWRCGGFRFVMCVECSGSCRVVGEDGRKSVKCSKCNENGLIQCPKCCFTV